MTDKIKHGYCYVYNEIVEGRNHADLLPVIVDNNNPILEGE